MTPAQQFIARLRAQGLPPAPPPKPNGTAEQIAERNVQVGSAPCTLNFREIEEKRKLPEGLTRKQVGPPRIW
jgi:hypothetical protein